MMMFHFSFDLFLMRYLFYFPFTSLSSHPNIFTPLAVLLLTPLRYAPHHLMVFSLLLAPLFSQHTPHPCVCNSFCLEIAECTLAPIAMADSDHEAHSSSDEHHSRPASANHSREHDAEQVPVTTNTGTPYSTPI